METKTYITVKQSPTYRQMTLEELLFGTENQSQLINSNFTNTRTYVTDDVSCKLLGSIDIPEFIGMLDRFNVYTKELRETPRKLLYTTFYVPKKEKGMSYVFKKIFAMQKRYIECDTSAVFREINSMVKPVLAEHSTQEDSKMLSDMAKSCTEFLRSRGFEMTAEDFKEIVKGAYRRIDAPNKELKASLHNLKSIFENDFKALYHTSAFAYVKNRSTVDAVKRHQANKSRWFGKYDLSNFFGSTTVDFIMQMLSMIFPFSEVVKYPNGKDALKQALSLCVLDGVLPQGTPISPTITNIMMIPIDHKLSNTLRDFNGQSFVYTRYADDFLISSAYNFKSKEVEKLLTDTLEEFNAPFTVNAEKTRYGSSSGSNWNLGVMLNKDNQITVGYQKKRQFKAMISSYVMDKLNGQPWSKTDVQVMEGYRNYYRMIEGETIDKIIEHIGKKFNVNIVSLIKKDLRL